MPTFQNGVVLRVESNPNTGLNIKLKLAYPFKFEATEDFSEYRRDEQGIPTVYYPHLRRWVYNPITISQFGLHQLSIFDRTGDARALLMARAMADWLMENQEDWKEDIGAWVFRFDLPFYGPASPWISGMAQGQAISLLLRIGQLGDASACEEASHRAVRAFFVPVTKGGVVRNFPDGSIAFEEYPTVEPSLVLNGFLFALLGLHDYASYFGEARAKERFEICVRGLKKNLMLYDTGFWNLYDLHRSRRLAAPDYARIHVQLLNIFAGMTKEAYFADTADRWQGYLDNYRCRTRFYAGKVVEKIRLCFNDYQSRKEMTDP
jgi:hypothetical protein